MESFYSRRGFTLIELLVVLAIITFIMSIVFVNQGTFNKTIILENTAYDIALTLRNAETYGLGSRVTGNAMNTGYGIDFNASTPGAFILFADTYPLTGSNSSVLCHTPPANDPTGPNAQPGNCVYDSSVGESVQTYALGNGITISDFCALTGGSWSCAHKNGSGLSTLDIVFARPNPDAFMSANGLHAVSVPITAVCVSVSSPQGGMRYISVSAAGNITANAASCP